jgi:tetratricopeptide (TPR) repeat protein
MAGHQQKRRSTFMRRVVSAAVFLLVCPIAVAQHFHHAMSSAPEDALRGSPCTKKFAPAVLDAGLQKVLWRVTGNEEAKKFFSQGMTQYYGFNYEEAMRNFRGAAEADPGMAMASWGIALAAGPNINLGMGDACRFLALKESGKAKELAKTQQGITRLEVELIDVLPLRYEDPDTEAVAYSVATGKIWDHAEADPNVGALYAESLLELRPWALFDDAYRPALDTDRIYEVLNAAMLVAKDSVGPNHYWIHTVEASKDPRDALRSANLLRTLVAKSGHLVHMPSHIYQLTGDYKSALDSNVDAVAVDEKEYGQTCRGTFEQYKENPNCPQLYFGHYQSHNLFFGTVAATFLGRSKVALKMAHETREHAERFLANEPGLQRYTTAELMTLVMNRNWDAILKEPEPPTSCYIQPPFTKSSGCRILRSTWFWARGMAYATRGEAAAGRKEYDAMVLEMQAIVPPTPIGWGNNSAAAVLAIGQSMLRARLKWADTKQDEAIAHLKLAVTHEDALVYDEPPQWFAPSREALGGAYLQTAKFALAESTFNDDLTRHPGSGRALYGLMRALKGQGKPYAAVEAQFKTAWQYADYEMTDQALW